jgi:Flp pilus assembly protein TadG
MMSRFRNPIHFLRAEQGVAAIETALILPFMLLLYFGMIDLTAMISHNRKITYAASVAADLMAQNRTTVLKPATLDYFAAVDLIMAPTPSTRTRVNLYGFRSSGGAISQIWTTSNNKGPACSTLPNTADMGPLMTANNDVVVAIACMEYTPYVATFLGVDVLGSTSFDVEQTVMVRPRSTALLICYQTTVAAGAVCT